MCRDDVDSFYIPCIFNYKLGTIGIPNYESERISVALNTLYLLEGVATMWHLSRSCASCRNYGSPSDAENATEPLVLGGEAHRLKMANNSQP